MRIIYNPIQLIIPIKEVIKITENNSSDKKIEEMSAEYVRGYFDGILSYLLKKTRPFTVDSIF